MSDPSYHVAHQFVVRPFIWAAATVFRIDVFRFVKMYSPKVAPDPEPESGGVGQKKVCTEFGTYRIRALTHDEYFSKAEQHRSCQRFVELYEKSHNTWRGVLVDQEDMWDQSR